jgi:hypothetical protein
MVDRLLKHPSTLSSSTASISTAAPFSTYRRRARRGATGAVPEVRSRAALLRTTRGRGLLQAALAAGHEGVMAKALDAPYEACARRRLAQDKAAVTSISWCSLPNGATAAAPLAQQFAPWRETRIPALGAG